MGEGGWGEGMWYMTRGLKLEGLGAWCDEAGFCRS